jgi:homoserine/homoserine lactone efflux protein
LGLQQFFAKANEADVLNKVSNLNALNEVPSFRRRVMTGFLTNASNPKGIVFMVAVLPNFINSHAPILPQLTILAVTMVFVDTTVMHGYAFLASSLQRWMRHPKAQNIQNKLFGSVLVLVGTSLFFVKRDASVVV